MAQHCPSAQSGQLLAETLGINHSWFWGQPPASLLLSNNRSSWSCSPSQAISLLTWSSTHNIWADGPAAQRELRKSNFSPNWCLPAFLSYVLLLNIPFFFSPAFAELSFTSLELALHSSALLGADLKVHLFCWILLSSLRSGPHGLLG